MKTDCSSPDRKERVAPTNTALSPGGRTFLDRIIERQGRGTSGKNGIPRRGDGSAAPLSFAQQRLWFLDQLEGKSPTYNAYRAWRLNGALNVDALRKAIETIVARHEVLRSTFPVVDGEPAQVTAAEPNVPLSIVDLQGLPSPEREAESTELVFNEAKQPFDLTNEPLIRVKLLKLAAENHILFINLHHIVTDGWSMGVLHRELAALYGAFAAGRPSPLPHLAIQYSDYAVWQREWLRGEIEEQLAYWKGQLARLSVLQMPTDWPRPVIRSYRGARESFRLSAGLTTQLRLLSREQGGTLFMTTLAAVKALLHRYTRQNDIVVGTPIANRNRAEIEPLIGMFVNTLVLRTDCSGDPTFLELLGRVKQMALAAYSHQDLPFEKLAGELQPEREFNRNPLFQVAFTFQNTPDQGLALPGLSVTPLATGSVSPFDRGNGTSKFDLMVSMMERDGAIDGALEYSTDLFQHATIERMAHHLQTLLQGVADDPERRLSALPLLTEAERHQLLIEWNDTKRDDPGDACIHQLFEAQAERTPDAAAVLFEDKQLTYRELNRRANQLAHHLRKLGVGPETLVGICMERSLEMVIGLLGILKAGGAYIPLDPDYPKERLAFMLEDANVSILLTQLRLVERLPQHGAKMIHLDGHWEAIARESEENPVSGVTAENLAYVIFTSGSTGRPKGAMNTHGGICNRLLWMQDAYRLTDGDRVLQKTPFSFDVSVWEFFWPLSTGACLIIARPGGHRDNGYLVKLIAEQKITRLHFIPSMLQVFLEQEDLEVCSCLRHVICSGEALPLELEQRFFARLGAELHNLYGPTETAIDVTFWACKRENNRRSVSIGRPIANTQIYLLDQHLQPVPVGVSGELYIGGIGVGRGYHNRPHLTAEKFIPNPFSKKPGARLYKTGDLARYLPDGNIEFLGRIDHQVKIRGFRIELGEIESVLGQHVAVREVIVLAREEIENPKSEIQNPKSYKRLVAYIVAQKGQVPTSAELRSFLKRRLPDYMVPSAFVMLEVFPLTPNGKVNRQGLPAPDPNRSDLQEMFVAPHRAMEAALAKIWAQILRIEKVGIHDNFFDLGGDSILSIHIVARANQAGLRITPKDIFEYQTIAELLAVAGTNRTVETEQSAVTGEVPLTPIQHWFFEQNFPDPHHWNQAMLLEARDALDPALLKQAVHHLLLHHDALRLRFNHEAASRQQFSAAPDPAVPFSTVDLSALSQREQGPAIEAAAAELQASLNLSEGPLLRAAFFDLGAQRPGRFLIVIHHLAVDGVSWRILLEDVQTIYQQLSRGETISLLPKTTSFKHWSERLTEYVRSPDLRKELDSWLALSRPDSFRLPRDYPDRANTFGSVCTVSVALSEEETRALTRDVPMAYHTQINDVLLTALAQAFSCWTGTDSLFIDLEGHGREPIFQDVDLSRTVGWFTTIFPVLLDLRKASHPAETLKSVKEHLREIPNRGIGYGLLRYLSDDAAIRAKLAQLPQPEVSFNYLGQFDQVLPENGLFAWATEPSGPAHSLHGRRRHLLAITGRIVRSRLELNWAYSENLHRPETIQSLADDFIEALRAIVTHCRSVETGSYTPSDFPLADLKQKELDDLRLRIDMSEGNIEDIYPLSHLQQGMLFHTLYDSLSGVYFDQAVYALQGELNVLAFKQAWQKVLDRHPILRTLFYWEERNDPLQIVCKDATLLWTDEDWRGLPRQEQQERLETYLKADRERGFELWQAPLVRLALIQVAEDAYHFIWSRHHLLLDRWSSSLVLKEVSDFYKAFCRSEQFHPEPSRPYRDYIAWLRHQDLSRAEVFWRRTLKGFTTPTPLATNEPNPRLSAQEGVYDSHQVRLALSMTTALQSLAMRHRLTMNTLVQGAWALVLSRYSGEEDVVFGTTVSGRPADLPGVESMVGLFINTLPLRVKVVEGEMLLPWLKRLQSQMVELRQYEYSPLMQVQGWSEVPRGQPLFESILVFENVPAHVPLQDVDGLEACAVRSGGGRTNYPLTVVALPGPEFMLRITYDCSRFDARVIARMLRHFETLLQGIVANPDRRLSDLPILTEAERQQVLVEWNDTRTDYPAGKCIHELFEEQAERTPDAVAVGFENDRLTYEELNRRANQLAHYLRKWGVGPEVLVAVCLERSLEMVIALLAVLKAGGAYIPLDPNYPEERLTFMLDDSRPWVVLTQQALLSQLPEMTDDNGAMTDDRRAIRRPKVICLDTWEATDDRRPLTANNTTTSFSLTSTVGGLRSSPDNISYVIYTSGSTGKPKGVSVTHRGVVRLVKGTNYVELTEKDVFLQFAPLSFDASTFEIWGALLNGAKLVVFPPYTPTLEELGEVIKQSRVTTLWLTAALFHQMVEGHIESLSGVRQLLAGGDVLSVPHTRKALKELPGCRLINGYGPTENTTFTCCYQMTSADQVGNSVSIGRPVTNSQAYLLDQYLHPVPIGIPGEIYIGGEGLARGYFNNPDLTAEKFIPNPFSNNPGERLYRTGDLARYLTDGNIEFLGRIDNQVKIRGFRIELGEIESMLGGHPAVRETVVLAREDTPGDKRLAAYVISNPDLSPSANELRAFLKESLPDYMVPSAFIFLAALPLTPNGKVDRRALPVPDQSRPDLEDGFVAPRTSVEEGVAKIWAEVLGLERIGIQDNFFDLGGHSLLATQVMSRVRAVLKVELPLRSLFEVPTVAGLAERIETILWAAKSAEAAPGEREEIRM